MTGEVPARARELAVGLSGLFERDVEIVERLNDAQRCLACANERLWSGLAPEAFGLVYDGAAPAGSSQVAALSAGGLGSQTEVLAALQEIHWTIRRAFHAYQSTCEERRQLAVDVGELSVQLVETLATAGWTEEAARRANVHELAIAGAR